MKKKDINSAYEENPVEDSPSEEPSGKKKKGKKKKQETEGAPESRKEQNKVFVKASYFFVLMFLSLCGYLVYFNIADRESINSNSYNTKQDTKDNMVKMCIRDSIIPVRSVAVRPRVKISIFVVISVVPVGVLSPLCLLYTSDSGHGLQAGFQPGG